jgi:hypothetical protein
MWYGTFLFNKLPGCRHCKEGGKSLTAEGQTPEERSAQANSVTNGRLQEIRFWVTIMKEHALFIALGLPCDQTILIAEARAFAERFELLEERVRQATIIDPELLDEIIGAVRALIAFQRGILALMLQCSIRPSIPPLFVDHITREAVHFLELLLRPQPPLSTIQQIIRRSVFWLRQMKEHIEFIIHLLDPSERLLINQAKRLLEVFRKLLETARDLESMSESQPRFFNAAVRFIFEVNEQTAVLRDFKATAHELVVLCRVLSTVPDPLLTDHVRREADKFLKELEEFKSLTNVCESLRASQ